MEKKSKVDQLKDMMKAKKEAEERKQTPPSSSAAAPLADRPPPPPPNGRRTGAGEEGGSVAGDSAATDEMESQIKAAEDEAKAHYDKLLRVMAEFENFKKRIERERVEQAKYANQSLIHDLLPVMDDFDRVLEHIPKDTTPEINAIVDGIKLVQNHFMTALAKHGLVALEPSAGRPFDPNEHEAVAHIENDEHPEGTVCMEHRRGWKLHDRVVRPATVAVSKGKLQ
jgi:molecular chaperone GrpE